METWAIVAIVLGSNIIIALSTFFATKIQVSHSDTRFEKQLERAREANCHQRRWEVRGEPLLKLRAELALMATKQDRVAASAHKLHTRIGMTEEEAKKELRENLNDVTTYLSSGSFQTTLFVQYDKEIVDKVEEITREYHGSYIDGIYHEDLKATELGKAMEVLTRNKARIIEVQSLINERLEEL